MQLTFYLFRNEIQAYDAAIHSEKTRGRNPFRSVRLVGIPYAAQAYVQRDRKSEPTWLSYIQGYCDPTDLGKLENRSCSFVLLLRTTGRIFAITFGHGHILLNEDAYEQDFGLRVTMNTVGENKLRGVQSRNFGSAPVHKHIVASRESNRNVFDIDSYLELLASVEGVVDGADLRRTKAASAKNKKLLGTRIAGSTSCSLRHDATFAELQVKCDELWAAYSSTKYRDIFPEYDNVRIISDDATLDTLRRKLVDLVVARDRSVSLMLPDISSRGSIENYKVRYPDLKSGRMTELDIDEFYGWLDANGVDGVDVLKARFIGIGDGEREITSQLNFERTAIWEGDHNGETYALTLGRWYRLDKQYVKAKNKEFQAQLKNCIITKTGYLPLYPKKIAQKKGVKVEREGLYNEYCCNELGDGYCLMDKKFVRMGTPIEVCDIYTKNGEFIHVKRGTSNASISHLFAQASVSSRLFCETDEYRKQFRSKLPADLHATLDHKPIDPKQFTVVIAVIEKKASFPAGLSFFKKLNLLHHLKIIRSLRLNAKFYSIGHE